MASDEGIDAILVDINTLGGRLDAMIEIRDAIVDSPVLTIGYVNPRAISAGALIAIACDSLYMAPGGSIGAATPVSGESGEKASEKVVSYGRTEFRSTAESKGRPAGLAEAMVDESVEIEGVIEEGKLLTLTATRAVELDFAEAVLETRAAVLARSGLERAEIRTLTPNWAENFIRFLNNPVIAGILMAVIFFGIIAEVQTAGWGVPGTAALLSLGLFLGGRFVVGLVGFEELLLLLLGVTLMLVEVLAIPGFGVVGILGIVCLLASLTMALLGHAPTLSDVVAALYIMASSMVGAVVASLVLFRFVGRTPMWSRVKLATAQPTDEGWVASEIDTSLVGLEGVAATDLRPAGAVTIAGKRYDVVSEAEFIERGARVRVLAHEGYRIVVQEVAPPPHGEDSSA
jgi:membrane-bound serine protease (ClpP class)